MVKAFGKHSAGKRTLFTGAVFSLAWCCTSLLILYFFPESFCDLDYKIYDAKLSLLSTQSPSSPIVHLDVDDPAVKKYGQWPWDRRMSAHIVDKLTEFGAKAIVFDIIFSAQGRSVSGDDEFFKSTARSNRVVLAMSPVVIGLEVRSLEVGKDTTRADALYDRAWKRFEASDFLLYKAQELRDSGLPLLQLIQGAKALGHIKATPDSDGVHRRIPLVISLEDRLLPSLSLAALTTCLGVGPEAVSVPGDGTIEIRHRDGTLRIPVNSHAELLINWMPPGAGFQSYSVLDLFDKRPETTRASRYRDKIVVVGVSWTGATDIGANPFQCESLLSRVHSNALSTILTGRFLHEVSFFPFVAAGTFLVAILFVCGALKMPLEKAIVCCCIVVPAYALIVLVAFVWGHTEIPLVQPLFVFLPAAVSVLATHSIANDKERRMIRETFGRYLSDEVVQEILKSPGGVRLQGELREITILVSDLRGFTSMTESLPPNAVLRVINRYLEKMTDIILRHHGTINEIMGDGILVLFGAPREIPDASMRAMLCALEMQEAMTELNSGNVLLGLPELGMGIGINCGELVVGNIGSEKRKKYGAVGNAINVAFRVEAATLAGQILITEPIYRRYADRLEVAEHRRIQLKGIHQPVSVYHVVGFKEASLGS